MLSLAVAVAAFIAALKGRRGRLRIVYRIAADRVHGLAERTHRWQR